MNREEARKIIAAIVKLRESVTDEQALAAQEIYPAWREEVEYAVGIRVLFEGTLYKVLQTHTSQADWTPSSSPSLFAKVLIPDMDFIPEWERPDSTNGYAKGDKVVYNGDTWISLTDNNVWEPSESLPTIWKIA